MPFSPYNRFQEIDTGDQIDTWGVVENKNKEWLDQTLDGILNITVDGDRPLIYSNGGLDDEGHFAAFRITSGSGGTVIMNSNPAIYFVRNDSEGDVTFRSDVGMNTVVEAGSFSLLIAHPIAGVAQLSPDGSSLKGYLDNMTAALKTYADNLAFDSASAQLPGQSGQGGNALYTDGTVAGWRKSEIADVNLLQETLDDQSDFTIAAAIIF